MTAGIGQTHAQTEAQYRDVRAAWRRGDVRAAEESCRRILESDPQHFDALQMLGLIEAQCGDAAAAAGLFGRALALRPDNAEAHNNNANALYALGRYDEAVAGYERAIALDPSYVDAYSNLGRALRRMGRFEQALTQFDRALTFRPDDAEAQYGRGVALAALQKNDAAVAAFDRVLELRPEHDKVHFQRGNTLWAQRRSDEALADYDRVITRDPAAAGAIANRSVVLVELGRPAEALHDIERALQLVPGNPDFWNLHGNALHALNRHAEAVISYSRALELFPSHSHAEFNISMCELVRGDFTRGWTSYESRWKTGMNLGWIKFNEPPWNGEAVQGRLLVWGEQAIGDQILHLGMLDALHARVKNTVVAVMPRLLPLVRRSFPGVTFVPLERAAQEPCDVQIPLGSIGRHVRRSWADFPVDRKAYLVADAARVQALRARIRQEGGGKGGLVVGLSWESRSRLFSGLKSISLPQLQPLLQLPGMRFVDLQYGDTQAAREVLRRNTGVELLRLDDVDAVNDIDGLAALVAACDLIVTTSNTTAHLAGALGAPTFLLLPFSSGRHWYWHEARSDSPWYPSMRLFSQSAPRQWDEVIVQVRDAVAARAGAGGTR